MLRGDTPLKNARRFFGYQLAVIGLRRRGRPRERDRHAARLVIGLLAPLAFSPAHIHYYYASR